MKLLIPAVLLFSLTAASCAKKDYTCTCKGGFSGGGWITNVSKTSEKRAQEACQDLNAPPQTADGFYDCTIYAGK